MTNDPMSQMRILDSHLWIVDEPQRTTTQAARRGSAPATSSAQPRHNTATRTQRVPAPSRPPTAHTSRMAIMRPIRHRRDSLCSPDGGRAQNMCARRGANARRAQARSATYMHSPCRPRLSTAAGPGLTQSHPSAATRHDCTANASAHRGLRRPLSAPAHWRRHRRAATLRPAGAPRGVCGAHLRPPGSHAPVERVHR